MYGRRMKAEKTTLYLDPKLARDLRRVARATGQAQATIIRRALQEFLVRQDAPQLDPFVGCVSSNDPRLARRAKEELRAMVSSGQLDDR